MTPSDQVDESILPSVADASWYGVPANDGQPGFPCWSVLHTNRSPLTEIDFEVWKFRGWSYEDMRQHIAGCTPVGRLRELWDTGENHKRAIAAADPKIPADLRSEMIKMCGPEGLPVNASWLARTLAGNPGMTTADLDELERVVLSVGPKELSVESLSFLAVLYENPNTGRYRIAKLATPTTRDTEDSGVAWCAELLKESMRIKCAAAQRNLRPEEYGQLAVQWISVWSEFSIKKDNSDLQDPKHPDFIPLGLENEQWCMSIEEIMATAAARLAAQEKLDVSQRETLLTTVLNVKGVVMEGLFIANFWGEYAKLSHRPSEISDRLLTNLTSRPANETLKYGEHPIINAVLDDLVATAPSPRDGLVLAQILEILCRNQRPQQWHEQYVHRLYESKTLCARIKWTSPLVRDLLVSPHPTLRLLALRGVEALRGSSPVTSPKTNIPEQHVEPTARA